MKKIKLSILDQSQIRRNGTAKQALNDSGELVQLAEKLGYTRYWVSEHHNFKMLAGTAPEVLIPYLASKTTKIKVGSGGIMLPNHSAFKVAEIFGLLETLYPDRIDLGVGRAPGGDRMSSYLLNPSNAFSEKEYYQQLTDLQGFLRHEETPETVHEKVKSYPKPDVIPDLWILSSSGGSAQFAAHFGIRLSFAQFINPDGGAETAAFYRENFKPSTELKEPKVNVGIFAFCSENEQKVKDWITEFDYRLLHIESGASGELPSLEEIKAMKYNLNQKARIAYNKGRYIAGNPEKLKVSIEKIVADYETDEVMVATICDDFEDRKKSYELLAKLFLES